MEQKVSDFEGKLSFQGELIPPEDSETLPSVYWEEKRLTQIL